MTICKIIIYFNRMSIFITSRFKSINLIDISSNSIFQLFRIRLFGIIIFFYDSCFIYFIIQIISFLSPLERTVEFLSVTVNWNRYTIKPTLNSSNILLCVRRTTNKRRHISCHFFIVASQDSS